jgi:hypothetical protein
VHAQQRRASLGRDARSRGPFLEDH